MKIACHWMLSLEGWHIVSKTHKINYFLLLLKYLQNYKSISQLLWSIGWASNRFWKVKKGRKTAVWQTAPLQQSISRIILNSRLIFGLFLHTENIEGNILFAQTPWKIVCLLHHLVIKRTKPYRELMEVWHSGRLAIIKEPVLQSVHWSVFSPLGCWSLGISKTPKIY